MRSEISFGRSLCQFLAQSQTVTRRVGFWAVMPGDVLEAVDARGTLGNIEVIDAWTEPLTNITAAEVAREGYPNMAPGDFIAFFCDSNKCRPNTLVRRIEFRYLQAPRKPK